MTILRREGRVEMGSEWTARKRERAGGILCSARTAPLKSNRGLDGPPAHSSMVGRLVELFLLHTLWNGTRRRDVLIWGYSYIVAKRQFFAPTANSALCKHVEK